MEIAPHGDPPPTVQPIPDPRPDARFQADRILRLRLAQPVLSFEEGHAAKLVPRRLDVRRRAVTVDFGPEHLHVAFVTRPDEAADVDVRARQVGRGVEQVVQLVAQQQVPGFIRIEARQPCFVLFLETFEMDRRHVRQRSAGIARRIECILRVGSGFPVAVIPEVRNDHLARAAPPCATAEALHEAGPGSELGEQKRCGDVHARFDHLGGDDDAVHPRRTCRAVEEGAAPGLAFVRTKTAVDQANVRARRLDLLVHPERFPDLDGALDRVENDQGRPFLSTTTVAVTSRYVPSERLRIGKRNDFQGLGHVIPWISTPIFRLDPVRIPRKLPGHAGGVRALLQPAALQGRAHPPRETGPQRLARASILVPKRLKLS